MPERRRKEAGSICVAACFVFHSILNRTKVIFPDVREGVATGYSPYSLFERDAYLDPIRGSREFVQFMAEMKPIYERRRAEFR